MRATSGCSTARRNAKSARKRDEALVNLKRLPLTVDNLPEMARVVYDEKLRPLLPDDSPQAALCERLARNFDNVRSNDELISVERRSYPIFGGVYRHSYLRLNGSLEIHPGLPQRVTFVEYYANRRDRLDETDALCAECADRLLRKTDGRMRFFHLMLNNCDTIAGDARQTLVCWSFGLFIALAVGDLFAFLLLINMFFAMLVTIKIRNESSSSSSDATSSVVSTRACEHALKRLAETQ